MKTEREIRRHRDDLHAAASRPCDCRTLPGMLRCQARREEMALLVGVLDWVLGEDFAGYDRVAEELAAARARGAT